MNIIPSMAPKTPGRSSILIKVACFCNMVWRLVRKKKKCHIVVMSGQGNLTSSPLINKKKMFFLQIIRFCKNIA